MKKKYTRKSNPVNNTGYTPGYSTENNPFNIIPSENITMRNTPYPVQGTPLDQNGYPMGDSIAMQPGQDYKFGGASFVLETPNFAKGGTKQNWISDKIGKLMREGYPQKQAIAIAYSMYNQKHANGGYQLPMYQLAGTQQLDAFGQPIPNEQATATAAPTGNLYNNGNFGGSLTYGQGTGESATTGDTNALAGTTDNEKLQWEGLQPAGMAKIPTEKPVASDTLEEDTALKAQGEAMSKKIREEEDVAKKAREDAEKNRTPQSTNPFGGYGMEQSIFNAGDAYQKGDTLGVVANTANVLFEGTKGFLGGMGSAKVGQQQKQDYYQKQLEGMTGQNAPTVLGKRGGRFTTFKLGGYQLPMYQQAGLYPGEEEGSYGQNESMDRGVNSEQQRRAILLRAEPGSVTVEEAPKDYVEPAKEQAPAFDSSSARDMWVHKTGMPWSKAKELGYTTGSAQDNMKLLSELKDERFKKENLRTEAPKRKTANRKAIDLKPKVSAPVERNAYGIDPNSPAAIAFRAEIDNKYKNAAPKETTKSQRNAYGIDPNSPAAIAFRAEIERGYAPKQSRSVMFPNYSAQRPLTPLEQALGNPYVSGATPMRFEQGGTSGIEDQVAQELQKGTDPQQILEQLIQMGVPQEQAIQMIEAISSSPEFAIGGYFQKGGRKLFGQKPTAQQAQSVMFGNTRPQPSAVDKAFGTMQQRSAARNALVERDMNRPSTTAMQMPLTYLQNPLKVVGDTAQYIAPGSKVSNWLPNSQEDRRAILENRHDTGITDSERLRNTSNMAAEKAPMAALNVGAGMYFAGEKGAAAVANEIFNPAKQVSHVLHGQGIWNKAKNLGEVGAHHIAAHSMHQEGGIQSPEEEQMGGEMPNPQEEQGEVPQQEQMQQLMQQISEALQQGADPQQILQQLMQMGIPQQQAQQMIQMAMQELQGGQQQAPQGTPQLRYGGRMYQEGGEAMDEEMEGEDEGAEGESPNMEQIEDQVEQALKQGADPQQILEQLIQMGMPEQQAVQMIQEILQEIQGGETEMEAPEQGNPQMRAGGKYLEILKGKTIKSYSLNKKTGNYEVQYS